MAFDLKVFEWKSTPKIREKHILKKKLRKLVPIYLTASFLRNSKLS